MRACVRACVRVILHANATVRVWLGNIDLNTSNKVVLNDIWHVDCGYVNSFDLRLHCKTALSAGVNKYTGRDVRVDPKSCVQIGSLMFSVTIH